MSIRSLLTGLLDARVDFIVVGMAAGQMHGSRLLTEDIDIVYKQCPANIARLAAYLHEIDAEKSLTLSSRDGELDVLHRIDGVGEYDEVLTMSETIPLGNAALRIITT